jgi:uncharacterized protein
MRVVFVDSAYWIALASPQDEYHKAAAGLRSSLGTARLVTTDEVLVEFLAHFSRFGARMRKRAAETVRRLLQTPNVRVIPQTRESFLSGLDLYEARLDKEYSLTDCISMQVMRVQNLTEVLTTDRHFSQEGLTKLIA